MDKEVASCPTTEADQSPNDDMPDGRTNEEVGEQRKANIRKRMALEKEEKEARKAARKEREAKNPEKAAKKKEAKAAKKKEEQERAGRFCFGFREGEPELSPPKGRWKRGA